LVGLADPDPAGRTAMAARIGAPRSYADYRELLDRERPELVSIAPRHADRHHEIGLACLRAGAHCYFEKPFTRTPAEADDLLREAGARGLRIGVAHTMRLMPVIRRLRREVETGALGELRELRAYGKQDARAGGEDMMVLGTHLFDLLRLFCGDPGWVTAQVLTGGRDITPADRRTVKDNVGWVAGDQVFAQFGFGRGVHATFTSDAKLRETVGHWGIEFHGSRGVARLRCDLEPAVYLRETTGWLAAGREDRWRVWPVPPEEAGLERAVRGPADDWLQAIREAREPGCSGRDGAWAVEMVAGVYRAALGGRRTVFPLAERSHPLEG
jgi:predicted dehydrogenase